MLCDFKVFPFFKSRFLMWFNFLLSNVREFFLQTFSNILKKIPGSLELSILLKFSNITFFFKFSASKIFSWFFLTLWIFFRHLQDFQIFFLHSGNLSDILKLFPAVWNTRDFIRYGLSSLLGDFFCIFKLPGFFSVLQEFFLTFQIFFLALLKFPKFFKRSGYFHPRILSDIFRHTRFFSSPFKKFWEFSPGFSSL